MKTKQQVIDFLESKLGTKVPCIGNSSLDGQCVTLIKALMEFLGVDNPYKARGHAKDCIATYLNEGIADPGIGFLSVFSNKNMGVVNGVAYGHIWCNAGEGDGTYYESNGQQALTVTKGKTYSYDNVCNFDKYITENNDSNESESNNMDELQQCKTDLSECKNKQERYRNERDDARNERDQLKEENADLQKQVSQYAENETKLTEENEKLRDDIDSLEAELANCEGNEENSPLEDVFLEATKEMVKSGAKVITNEDGQQFIEVSYKLKE